MKKSPIFRKIFIPVLTLCLAVTAIFAGSIFGQGIYQEIVDNETEVIGEKLNSKHNTVENMMLQDWADFGLTVEDVLEDTESYLNRKMVSIEDVCADQVLSAQLLERLTPNLLDMMQTHRVTGAYLILNTDDLSEDVARGTYNNKQGVYLKNNDPNRQAMERNQNVLMLRSPISVVQNLEIAMDPLWDLNFDFGESDTAYYDFFYIPYQTAYENQEGYDWSDMGRWCGPDKIDDSTPSTITYTVPLILSDGTVFGVMGIDIAEQYLQSILMSSELDGYGTYFLANYREDIEGFQNVIGASNYNWVSSYRSNREVIVDGESFYVNHQALNIYPNNTPFVDEQWVLGVVVPTSSITSFYRQLMVMVLVALILTILIAVAGSILTSYSIQHPVAKLVKDMRQQNPNSYIELQDTGITEIDRLSDEIEKLSRNVIDSNRKFSQIMEMASTRIAGYQLDEETQALFVSADFFKLFGMNLVNVNTLTIPTFYSLMNKLEEKKTESDFASANNIYKIADGDEECFIQLKIARDGHREYGLAEDITETLKERNILAYERDHDSLTNLYNRRAFRSRMQTLFEQHPEKIRTGALLMLDLDNLKFVNDNFGHDMGDQYIRATAAALEKSVAGSGCYARISGDEFNVFFYGFENEDEIRSAVTRVREALFETEIQLPDGKKQQVLASGGVAFYPQDSTDLDELQKYADQAMYLIKKTRKGSIGYFDKDRFTSLDLERKRATALTRLLEYKEAYYAMQPIVDAHTGDIFAYEALMRPTNEELPTVGLVLQTAKQEGKLNQIEEFTVFNSMDRFVKLREKGLIDENAYVFVNTMANQLLMKESSDLFLEKFGDYTKYMVLEVTEEMEMDVDLCIHKIQGHRGHGGMVALDDYGNGYNGEKMLLYVSPEFIKIDISIIRNIHVDTDKQALFKYMVDYAHERNKLVIAEGVELEGELEMVINLGADYIQGYVLAKPERYPGRRIPEAKRALVRRLSGTDSAEHESTELDILDTYD